MNLVQSLESELLERILAEAKDSQDEAVKVAIAEWKEMKKKLAVVEKIGKAISAQIAELESGFSEVIKEVDGNRMVVDNAIVEYVKKKGNTTVKYKEVVEYTLNMVNEAQKEVIIKFMESVTKSGEIKNVLAVTDPELEKYLIDLGDATGEELMAKIETQARTGFDRLPKQIANSKKRELKEGVVKNIVTIAKNLASKFRVVFKSFFVADKKAKKAIDELVKAVKAA